MTLTLDATGLTIDTYDTILESIVSDLGTALGLTPPQVARARSSVRSVLGNMSRIEAEREAALQEALLAVYQVLTIQTEGVPLENVVRLLGVERLPAYSSRVLGTANGTAATVIPDGTRLRYEPEGTVWVVVDGPYVIGGGGSISDVAIESDETEAHTVELGVGLFTVSGDPQWTILDTILGFSDVGSFDAIEQPIVGAPIESDTALRVRARREAYRRGQGPLVAIEAAVSGVEGVTFVRVWENTGRLGAVDADGIPGRAINVVVEGGSNADVVAAILASRPAGMLLHGTDVEEIVGLGSGRYIVVAFDRVADIPIWIRATALTSTSEEAAPANVTDVIAARLLAQGPLLFGIGDDVLPLRLAAACVDIPGFDELLIELSTDDGALDPYSTAKRGITIRQRSTFDATRIAVAES